MQQPTIDLAALPSLAQPTGVFGSVPQAGVSYNDTIVAIMVYVYDSK